MGAGSFVHLHVHSDYSLLDGAARVPRIVEAVARHGMPAVALTDHGNLFGAVAFYKAAQEAGIKPILGMEAYVAPGDRRDRSSSKGIEDASSHLTLLAATDEGWRNLMRLSTLSYREGFYYRPRVDKQLLAECRAGLIALSGCLNSEFGRAAGRGDKERARAAAATYREIFGPENFFLEVMDHGMQEQRRLVEIAVDVGRGLGLRLVATNDAHYVEQKDARMHDSMLAVSTGKRITDEGRLRFEHPEFYLKDARRMRELFAHLPGACDATLDIADRCSVRLPLGGAHMPRFTPPDGLTPEQYLRRLCEEALPQRYPQEAAEARERLEHELAVIERTGFAGYFLIVADIVQAARRMGVHVGPGRGSAPGSIVAYLLGITEVDPLKYGLIFERFLNPQRIEMPDIDLDFAHDGRGRVVEYCRERYGVENVAQIITFATLKAKSAVRDVGRALGIELAKVNKVIARFPEAAEMAQEDMPDFTLEDVLEFTPELRRWAQEDPEIARLFEVAQGLEGLCRHASVHAAGVVIGDRPLIDLVPLWVHEGREITQFDMTGVTDLGLLKVDLLGLQTLTAVARTVEWVCRRTGREMDVGRIPAEDAATAQMLARGDVRGVFQLDGSAGMRDLVMRMKPRRMEDLIPVVALYRPGPMQTGMVEEFLRVRAGEKPPEYAHPDLVPVLEETYGTIIYQEQVMRIANRLAGFTMAEADQLRKAMGKKKREAMEAARDRFVERAVAQGVDEATARRIGDQMTQFAKYCFNKSHATAYAILAWRTAYLKAHYPVEYMAALISAFMEKSDKMVPYIEECRRMGIALLPPDVNRSEREFVPEGEAIRCGLGAVRNLGDKGIEAILAARAQGGPFRSLSEFIGRIGSGSVDRRQMENLVKSGALDCFGVPRAALWEALGEGMARAEIREREQRTGQMTLFGSAPAAQDPEVPERDEWPLEERLAYEREVLGFYVSGDPLDRYAGLIEALATVRLEGISGVRENQEVVAAGMVGEIRVRRRRSGNPGEKFLSFRLSDGTGSCEALAFGREFEREQAKVVEGAIVFVRGAVLSPHGRPAIRVSEVIAVSEAAARLAGLVVVRIPQQAPEGALAGLRAVLEAHRGTVPVVLEVCGEAGTWHVALPDDVRVEPDEVLVVELEDLFGAGAVRFRSRMGAGRTTAA
jgi:DNA polymerase-3 subunit alpha